MNGILNGGRSMVQWLGSVLGTVDPARGTNATFDRVGTAVSAVPGGRPARLAISSLTTAEGTPLTIIAGSPDRRIAGSPDRRIAGSPDRRIAGSPDRRIAGSPDRRIAGSPDRRIAGSPDRRIAGSPDRRIAGSPDRGFAGSLASSWWRRLRRSASRPESSASAGRRSDTRRPASSSDSFDLSPARAAAGARAAARNLRRGLFSVLLCLPLLFGLAAPATAQTTPTISPSTLIENAVRGNFGTTVTVSNIPSDWVTPVNHALTTTGTGTGHATIATSTCSLEDAFNTSLDTYDVCAGTNGAGYNSNNNSYQIEIRAGLDSHSDSGETFTVTLTDSSTPANTLSFTMTINDPPVRIGVSLPDQEGVSRVDGKQLQEESTGSVAFPLSANEPLANDLTVCVRVSESGGDRVASGSEGIQDRDPAGQRHQQRLGQLHGHLDRHARRRPGQHHHRPGSAAEHAGLHGRPMAATRYPLTTPRTRSSSRTTRTPRSRSRVRT